VFHKLKAAAAAAQAAKQNEEKIIKTSRGKKYRKNTI